MKNVLLLCKSRMLEFSAVEFDMCATVDRMAVYKNVKTPILRLFRKLHLKSSFPLKEIWYDNWLTSDNNYDIVILFDSILSEDVLLKVQRKYSHSRLIFWYWNLVNRKTEPCIIRKYNFELWTFDALEGAKYNLELNSQFYFPQRLSLSNPCFDVFFIGEDGGRLEILIKLLNSFKQIGITNKFVIVSSRKIDKLFRFNHYLVNKGISYNEVLYYVAKSRCILEINKKNQIGLTLRTLEALFYKKKLITNNISILDVAFYNKQNIFIIDYDDWNTLSDFVNSPYEDVDENIVSYYEFSNWIKRFIL